MIKSMTAFANQKSEHAKGSVEWELRSVNHRYLDLNFRLPENIRELENVLREKLRETLTRGKVDIILRYQPNVAASELQLNEALLSQLSQTANKIKKHFGELQAPTVFDVLRYSGITETATSDISALREWLLAELEKLLSSFNQMREREGAKLSEYVEARLKEIEAIVQTVKAALPDILVLQREQLLKRFEEAKINLDPDRLEQEMVLVAQKIDVSEEIDRLVAHVTEVRHTLKSQHPVGRRLDFLMQEMNREANTLGSKSISETTTRASIDLKVLIEQMREQIQNIE